MFEFQSPNRCEFLLQREPLLVDFFVGIRLLPNTPLAAAAVTEGVIAADDLLMEPKFYLSRGVEGWIGEYLAELCSEQPGWTTARLGR